MSATVEVKRCMFNETCKKDGVHIVATKDHTNLKEFKAKYVAHLCDEHFKALGWSATVWKEIGTSSR